MRPRGFHRRVDIPGVPVADLLHDLLRADDPRRNDVTVPVHARVVLALQLLAVLLVELPRWVVQLRGVQPPVITHPINTPFLSDVRQSRRPRPCSCCGRCCGPYASCPSATVCSTGRCSGASSSGFIALANRSANDNSESVAYWSACDLALSGVANLANRSANDNSESVAYWSPSDLALSGVAGPLAPTWPTSSGTDASGWLTRCCCSSLSSRHKTRTWSSWCSTAVTTGAERSASG